MLINWHKSIALFWSACILALCPLVSLAQTAAGLPQFTDLVKQNSAAVVNIASTATPANKLPGLPPGMQIPGMPNEDLSEFLEKFFGGLPQDDSQGQSLGSGFIMSTDGYVITNNHVIKDADEIVVRLSDKREFKAKLIGSDESTDVAVLKIEAGGLPTVRTGNSTSLQVGEWVLAIGSPFGFDHSATAGIVSAKGRSLPNENYTPFIQTDVAINPGNSGGPLFNMNGEVVGVNSQIFSRTGGFMGLSFAIPIEVVNNVYQQIRDTGGVSRGWLGVLIQDVTQELAVSFGMSEPAGALVAKVVDDGPAAKAGLQPGDVIVEFNGVKIDNSTELPPLVGQSKIGNKYPLLVQREGGQQRITVEIAELPKDGTQALSGRALNTDNINVSSLKISVKDLSKAQRDKLELEADQGVQVETVEEGAAAKAGIRAGDVILMVDSQKITDARQFNQVIGKLPAGKTIPVLIQRADGQLFLALKTP